MSAASNRSNAAGGPGASDTYRHFCSPSTRKSSRFSPQRHWAASHIENHLGCWLHAISRRRPRLLQAMCTSRVSSPAGRPASSTETSSCLSISSSGPLSGDPTFMRSCRSRGRHAKLRPCNSMQSAGIRGVAVSHSGVDMHQYRGTSYGAETGVSSLWCPMVIGTMSSSLKAWHVCAAQHAGSLGDDSASTSTKSMPSSWSDSNDVGRLSKSS